MPHNALASPESEPTAKTESPATPEPPAPTASDRVGLRRRPFRRRWTRGRTLGYAVVLAAVARLIWTLLRDASLDPAHGALEPGVCRVVAVADDGTLEVAQPLASDTAEPPRRAVVRRVRLLGVSRPGASSGESKSRRSSAKHDSRAAQWLRATVQGQEAWLEFDRRRFDDEGCWLAYVHLRDRLVNVELVRAGWGRCEVQPGDSATRQRELRRAEIEARRAGRGAWGLAAPELVPAGPPG